MKKTLSACIAVIVAVIFSWAQEKEKEKPFDCILSFAASRVGKKLTFDTEAVFALFAPNHKWVLQSSGSSRENDSVSEYGISTGIGRELGLGNLGVFVFFDGLFQKMEGYEHIFHYQVRPTLRLKSQSLVATVFYAHPLIAREVIRSIFYPRIFIWEDDIVLIGNIEDYTYAKAIRHGGVEVLFAKKFFRLSLKGIVAEKGAYQLTAKIEYQFKKGISVLFVPLDGISVLLEGEKYVNGKGINLAWPDYGTIKVGVAIRFGASREEFSNLEKNNILLTDYPRIFYEKEGK